MTSQIIAAIAAAGLMGAGIASATETRSISALPSQLLMAADGLNAGGDCRVDVVRNGAPGSADITRQVLSNGGCICTITTGPSGSSNGSAEPVVSALLRDRACDGAPAPGNVGGQVAGAAGGSGTVLTVLIAVVGAGGLAAALGKDSKG